MPKWDSLDIGRDWNRIKEIEEAYFEFPWTKKDFAKCLVQQEVSGVIAKLNGELCGYMVYELQKEYVYLLNLAVHPNYRQKGIGTGMIEKLTDKLSPRRRTHIFLEIRETNLTAQVFFRSLGFKAIDTLRNFYDDNSEDAYLMEYQYKPENERLRDLVAEAIKHTAPAAL